MSPLVAIGSFVAIGSPTLVSESLLLLTGEEPEVLIVKLMGVMVFDFLAIL